MPPRTGNIIFFESHLDNGQRKMQTAFQRIANLLIARQVDLDDILPYIHLYVQITTSDIDFIRNLKGIKPKTMQILLDCATSTYRHCLTYGTARQSFPAITQLEIAHYPKYSTCDMLNKEPEKHWQGSVIKRVLTNALQVYLLCPNITRVLTKVPNLELNPGVDIVEIAYRLAEAPLTGVEWVRWRALLGYHDKYKQEGFCIHPLPFLRSIVNQFDVRERPRIARMLTISSGAFIYENINRPFMPEFIVGIEERRLRTAMSYPNRVGEMMTAETLYHISQCCTSIQQLYRIVSYLKLVTPVTDHLLVGDVKLCSDIMDIYNNTKVIDNCRNAGVVWAKIGSPQTWYWHLIVTLSDGYYVPREDAPRGVKLLARLPSIEWFRPKEVTTDGYQVFLNYYKWLAFM